MFVTVDIFYGESEEATLVPLSAVYEHPLLAQTGVYVAADPVPAEPGPEMQSAAVGVPHPAGRLPLRAGRGDRRGAHGGRRPARCEPGAWVVSLGQNLLAGQDAQARVRPVDWQWVERLQNLQREDLMRALNENRGEAQTSRRTRRGAMKITDVAVDRPIATTMVFLIIITIGVMGFRFLPVDLLPPIEWPQLTVRTNYPNVGPEEIERIVTDRVENALAGVPNVEKITSRSEEGQSRVTLEFAQGTNIDEAANDVRAALDRIRDDFPPEVESPRLWKFDPDNFPVVILGARSELGMEEMTRILEREISQRFEQIPGAGSVDVWGGVYREIQVQLLRDRLASSRLSRPGRAARPAARERHPARRRHARGHPRHVRPHPRASTARWPRSPPP